MDPLFCRRICCLVLFYLIGYVKAQDNCWSFMIGSPGFEKLDAMSVSKEGDSWLAGTFSLTLDFDPDTLVADSVSSVGFIDAFIASYNTEGEYRLAFSLPGIQVIDMDMDSSSNLYVCGYQLQGGDVDPGPGVVTLPAFGGTDAVILSYDKDGNFRWGKSFGSPGPDEASTVRVTPDQQILLGGAFFPDMVVDTRDGPDTLKSNGSTDVYMMMIDKLEEVAWAITFGGPESEQNVRVAVDNSGQGNHWVAFGHGGSVDLPLQGGTTTFTSQGEEDVLIAQVDTNSEVKAAWAIQGRNRVVPQWLVSDEDNNLLIGGEFTDTIDVDPGPGTYNFESRGLEDVFVLEYTPTGLFRGGMSAGGPNNDRHVGAEVITIGVPRYLTVTTIFEDEATIDTDTSGNTISRQNTGFTDSYLLLYPLPLSSLEDIRQIGSLEADVGLRARIGPTPEGVDPGLSVFYLSGYSGGTLDFTIGDGPGPCRQPMEWASNGSFDFYLMKTLFSIDQGSSSVQEAAVNRLSIFPNPAQTGIRWADHSGVLAESTLEVGITDVLGRLVLSTTYDPAGSGAVDISGLETGMYWLTLRDFHGRQWQGRFLKGE